MTGKTKTRIFNGEKYTFAGSFDTKWAAENGKDRERYRAVEAGAYVKFRLVKVVSKAPPQGHIWYDLYYRRNAGGRMYS